MADETFIEELKARSDIVEVIGRTVQLSRKGGRYWACCPFHHEKTPSFAVNADMQFYHCFGCGVSGDVIKFVREYERLDFMEALKLLADKAGMTVPDTLKRDGDTDERKKYRDKLYALMKDAARYYFDCLNTVGAHVREYLSGRGITDTYIARFGLGYCPDYDGLVRRLRAKGYTEKEMTDSGAATRPDNRLYDPMGGRLIVPILNHMGEVIAFGGRAMEKDVKAKYRNTSESMLFTKNKTLYALNMVKKTRQHKTVRSLIVVEGYMDAIALHQAGFDTTVASMGTALTTEQARLMRRFAEEVFICFDGDAAGQEATLRGLNLLRDAGLSVRVTEMPEGYDPDEFIRGFGAEAFQKLMDNAPPLSDFKLYALRKRFDLENADGRRRYVKSALSVIAEEKDGSVQEELLKALSKQANLTYDSLRRDLDKAGTAGSADTAPPAPPPAPPAGQETVAARFILGAMLMQKPYARGYAALKAHLTLPVHLKCYDYAEACLASSKKPAPSVLFEDAGDEECAELTAILESADGMTLKEEGRFYEDCIALLSAAGRDKTLSDLLRACEQETDLEKRAKLLMEIQSLTVGKKK